MAGKRKKKEGPVGDVTELTPQRQETEQRFADGLKEFDRLVNLKMSMRRKIDGFKRRAKITPGSIRRLLEDLYESLD